MMKIRVTRTVLSQSQYASRNAMDFPASESLRLSQWNMCLSHASGRRHATGRQWAHKIATHLDL